jgi:hypothetical protein
MRVASNYDWLFFEPTIVKVKTGKSLTLKDRMFEKYFQNLGGWDFEIQFSQEGWGNLGLSFHPVAVNRSEEVLATKVTVKSMRIADSTTGIVYLLPPLKMCDQQETIEILIDIIAGGGERLEYPWRQRIIIPGLSEINREIMGHKLEVDKIMKTIKEAQERYDARESYRDLFSQDDQLQVKAVKRMLSDLGLQTELTKPAFVIDLLGKKVAVEVTSHAGKITTKSDSLNQVSRFIQQERKQEKMVLVANTYSRLPLEERDGKEDFSREAKGFLEGLSVCCLSARCLYLLWKKVQDNGLSTESARDLILNTVGELAEDEIR